MFRITIEEILDQKEAGDQGALVKRYEQTVTDIDLPRIIAAINAKKRTYTPRKAKEKA